MAMIKMRPIVEIALPMDNRNLLVLHRSRLPSDNRASHCMVLAVETLSNEECRRQPFASLSSRYIQLISMGIVL